MLAPRSVVYHDTDWHFKWDMRSIRRSLWVTQNTILAFYKSCYWSEFLYLLPFLLVLYVAAYLDRINVGFAAIQMKRDLGLSDAVYGLGASLFFVGYFLFEIPSNLILERVGARRWISFGPTNGR